MNNEKLTELKEALQKDIRFLNKFQPQTTNLKLHDLSSYLYNVDEDQHEYNFCAFCDYAYTVDYKEFLKNENIDSDNWYTCGSTIIPLDKKLLTFSNTARDYVLDVEHNTNDYTLAIEAYIDEVHNTECYYSIEVEILQLVLNDVNELLKDKLFLTVEEEKKLELLEDIYDCLGQEIREELKDQLFDYYKVLRYIKSYKKHQIEYYKEWMKEC